MNAGLNNEETIIDRIIGYSQAHGNLFSKFSEQFCLSAMEPHLLIEARNMAEPSEEALSVSDFVRLFLLLIKHKQDETLYLAMTLKGLF